MRRLQSDSWFVQEIGIERVCQLESGILKQFEGRGDCFVFDGREVPSADLQPAAGRVHR